MRSRGWRIGLPVHGIVRTVCALPRTRADLLTSSPAARNGHPAQVSWPCWIYPAMGECGWTSSINRASRHGAFLHPSVCVHCSDCATLTRPPVFLALCICLLLLLFYFFAARCTSCLNTHLLARKTFRRSQVSVSHWRNTG